MDCEGSAEAADSVIDRILESAERLGHLPYMGHVGRALGTYEWVAAGLPYIVVYKIDSDNNELQITAVFHGAQDREGELQTAARIVSLGYDV
jgi:toxin ParE1/3/4